MTEQQITIMKVGPKQMVGQNKDISKWDVIVEEAIDAQFAIYSEKGATDLEANKGKQITVGVDEGKPFNGIPQFKIVKTPGWEKGSGGYKGGGGSQKSPEERAEIMAQAVMHATVASFRPGEPEDADIIARFKALHAAVRGAAGLTAHVPATVSDATSAPADSNGSSQSDLERLRGETVTAYGSEARVLMAAVKTFGAKANFEAIDEEELAVLLMQLEVGAEAP